MFLCFLFPLVKNENNTETSNPPTATTETAVFRGQFTFKPFEAKTTFGNKTYYGIAPRFNRRSNLQRKYPPPQDDPPDPPTVTAASTLEGTQIVYKINDVYGQLKDFKFLKAPSDKLPVLEFNLTLPPELLQRNGKSATPFIFRMTLPRINLQSKKDATPSNRGFLKMRGVQTNILEDTDVKLLLRKVASQISKSFNMSSKEARLVDPILVIGRRVGGLHGLPGFPGIPGLGRRPRWTTLKTTTDLFKYTDHKIGVRTRAGVTFPTVTADYGNELYLPNYTDLFEYY